MEIALRDLQFLGHHTSSNTWILRSESTDFIFGVDAGVILNQFIKQPLDMLTMLGFVILTGIVVNNAILLVEQTVLQVREEGMDVKNAIIEATRNRIRPIFMSTLTSLFGLVPLVIFPGAGSELYRGIGILVFGGLALSTIATLLIVPPMLSIFSKSVSGSSNIN